MDGQAIWFLLCLCSFQLSLSRARAAPEVTLSTGRVRGLTLVSAVNRKYYSFKGIPYAAPPVGDFRFKAPQPPASWNDTLEAFDIPPACAQPWRKLQFPESYSEDCLYINVFTPHLKPPRDTLMPVMVWIHGGKQYQGSSTSYKYGADFLVTEDVVVVTFNYRLGVFGYLNLYSDGAQGNAAAKDKVAALRWVQREIRQFGGDPGSVTIFGGSSGGQDVHCLYVSPMAQGLFHKAITQSGLDCRTLYSSYNFNPGVRMAEMMGCPSDNAQQILKCLRGITTQVLAEEQMEVVTPGPGESANPFTLNVEEDHGEEVFLATPPEDLLITSRSGVPYMIGINSGEGEMNLENPKDNPSQFTDFERDFEFYIPRYVREMSSRSTLNDIITKLKKFYFGDKPISYETVTGFMEFMMDTQFTFPTVHTAKELSSHASVYLYYFTFKGAFETPHESTQVLNLSGVNHGEELAYLFYRNTLVPQQNNMAAYPRECQVLTRMVRLWTNFAKYGNPTPNKTDGILDVTWLPMRSNLTKHLVINDTLCMEMADLLPDRVSLWESIYHSVLNDRSRDMTASYSILASVLGLAGISLLFLLYDSTCVKGESGSYARI